MDSVYAVIVTFNGIKWIDKCFLSLLNSSISIKIIVIDNGSSDITSEYIKSNFPTIELIETGKNLGFGQANNIGFNLALKNNADYVFLLNQDAWIDQNTVEKLIEAIKTKTDYGILSPFHLSYDGKKIEHFFNDYIIANYSKNYINDIYTNNVKNIYPVEFIHAAAWLLPTKVIKKVGGFDPLFFHYGEDNDYLIRLKTKNLNVGFVTNAFVNHFGTNEGLNNPSLNQKHKIVSALLNLKNPSGSMLGSSLVFIKNSFDSVTSALIYRQFKIFIVEIKVFWKVVFKFPKIISSRKIQKRDGAFLN